jgi:hypothetical protein
VTETPRVVVVDDQPQQPRRLLPPSILAVRVDNPPFPLLLHPVWTWSPDTIPIEGPSASPESVDNPPFSNSGRLLMAEVPVIVPTPDPLPTLPRYLPASVLGITVNNPPFAQWGPTQEIQQLAAQVQPDPWVYIYVGGGQGLQPYGRRQLPPQITGVTVNNPPFSSSGRSVTMMVIAQTWVPPPPPPVQHVPTTAGPITPAPPVTSLHFTKFIADMGGMMVH